LAFSRCESAGHVPSEQHVRRIVLERLRMANGISKKQLLAEQRRKKRQAVPVPTAARRLPDAHYPVKRASFGKRQAPGG
jgi:hypothetical protein